LLEKYGTDITLCPKCKQGKLVQVAIVYPTIFEPIIVKKITVTTVVSQQNKASP